jgi:hypothetical protein
MLARDRKPEATVITNLRIKESLRQALEREAEQHQISLNKEIINRLEDSLEADARLKFIDLAQELERGWLRFGNRFLMLELEEGIKQAIRDGDLDAARIGLRALEKTQEIAARRQTTKMEGNKD